ncbi:MAG: sulfatase [bacterium]|nr:sulfatase [bacterium]
MAVPAVLIGAVETTLTLRAFAPSFLELLYGANVHLLMAFASVVVARGLLWKLVDRVYVPAAVAMYVMVELSFTAAFWILKMTWVPRLSSLPGKFFAVGTVAVLMLAGAGLIVLAVRRRSSHRWPARASVGAGKIGTAFLALFVIANVASGVWLYPRRGNRVNVNASDRAGVFPDVFIILVDTLRRDHLAAFGYARPTSPNLDRFNSESFVFDAAYTPSNKTVPSVVSLFTGLYPTAHQTIGPFQGFPESVPTLADHFRAYGYRTAAFVANMLVSVERGFGQGFETFSPTGMPWWCHHGRTGVEALVAYLYVPQDAGSGYRVTREFFEWLDVTTDAPRFAYLHFMEPHSSYSPPEKDFAAVSEGRPTGPDTPPMFHEFAGDDTRLDWESLPNRPTLTKEDLEGMVARYDGEIHFVDRHFGSVLNGLRKRGIFEKAHIVFLTDHGEELGDHGGWFHGHSIYEELTASPLAYRPPGGVAGGRRIERPVSLVDFAATLLEALGMEPMALHQGRPIPEVLGRPTAGARLSVVSSLPPHLYSCRVGPWKLIRGGDPMSPTDRLFDLSADPLEQNDLSEVMPDTLAMVRDSLQATVLWRTVPGIHARDPRIDPETLERLRSLGYIR